MSITSVFLPSVLPATTRSQQGRWHVIVAHEVRRTFSGQDAFYRATNMALYLNDRDLAHVVSTFLATYPTLWKTAHRATELVLHRHLTLPPSQKGKYRHDIAHVRSATRTATTYTLSGSAQGQLTCTCPAFCQQPVYGKTGKPFCKHLLAYVFQQRLARPLPPPPTPMMVWTALQTTLKTVLQPQTWQTLFASITVNPKTPLPHLVLYVPNRDHATLLTRPQWQAALNRTLSTVCGVPASVRITYRHAPTVPTETRRAA
jgi:hypothetical protein